jgi:hypothetical protein
MHVSSTGLLGPLARDHGPDGLTAWLETEALFSGVFSEYI